MRKTTILPTDISSLIMREEIKMKITKRQLRRIIREALIKEQSYYQSGAGEAHPGGPDDPGQNWDQAPVSTDPQEVADLIVGSTTDGDELEYWRLEAIANREAGGDVSVYVEPALQILIDDGIFERTPGNLYMRMM